MSNLTADARCVIEKRIKRRVNGEFLFDTLGLDQVYIAGSSLRAEPANDIDLYPVNRQDFVGLDLVLKDKGIQYSGTKNAITVEYDGRVYQFCSYHKDSLEDLVNSFDYAHVQIGAKIKKDSESFGFLGFDKLYMSEEFQSAQVLQRTWFTGSGYPLSSLLRLPKYIERGFFSGSSYKIEMLKAMSSVVDRGFEDYEDFKDQLDAVDLGLVPEEISEASEYLTILFNSLNKNDAII